MSPFLVTPASSPGVSCFVDLQLGGHGSRSLLGAAVERTSQHQNVYTGQGRHLEERGPRAGRESLRVARATPRNSASAVVSSSRHRWPEGGAPGGAGRGWKRGSCWAPFWLRGWGKCAQFQEVGSGGEGNYRFLSDGFRWCRLPFPVDSRGEWGPRPPRRLSSGEARVCMSWISLVANPGRFRPDRAHAVSRRCRDVVALTVHHGKPARGVGGMPPAAAALEMLGVRWHGPSPSR